MSASVEREGSNQCHPQNLNGNNSFGVQNNHTSSSRFNFKSSRFSTGRIRRQRNFRHSDGSSTSGAQMKCETSNTEESVCVSSLSKSWVEMMEEDERECKAEAEKRSCNQRGGISTGKLRNHPSSERTTARKEQTESDPDVLQRRQKQIEYGKNTLCYQRYISEIKRSERSKSHPKTPRKSIAYSRRSWDKQIKIWRQQLHIWDPPIGENDSEFDLSSISDVTIDIDSPVKSSPKPEGDGHVNHQVPAIDIDEETFQLKNGDCTRFRTSSKLTADDELDLDYSGSESSSIW